MMNTVCTLVCVRGQRGCPSAPYRIVWCVCEGRGASIKTATHSSAPDSTTWASETRLETHTHTQT